MQVQEEVAHPTVLCEATNIEDCEPVKKFDVKKLYKDSPEVKMILSDNHFQSSRRLA